MMKRMTGIFWGLVVFSAVLLGCAQQVDTALTQSAESSVLSVTSGQEDALSSEAASSTAEKEDTFQPDTNCGTNASVRLTGVLTKVSPEEIVMESEQGTLAFTASHADLSGMEGHKMEVGITVTIEFRRAPGGVSIDRMEFVSAPKETSVTVWTAVSAETPDIQAAPDPTDTLDTFAVPEVQQEGPGPQSQPAWPEEENYVMYPIDIKPKLPEDFDEDDYAREVVKLVNEEREKEGLEPLEFSEDLIRTAGVRARELQEVYEHTRPDGTRFDTAYDSLKDYSHWGENIAKGQRTPESVMYAWMNSPGHRKNILCADYTHIGVGCTEKDGKLYWVQNFGGKAKDRPKPTEDKGQETSADEEENEKGNKGQSVDPTNEWELQNYRPVLPMTEEKAAAEGLCVVFISSEDGKGYYYSCHEFADGPGAEGKDLSGRGAFGCDLCSGSQGRPVRYLYENGQVYFWDW